MSDKKQQAADQVRPILRAMERSIENARNRRQGIDDEPRIEATDVDKPITSSTSASSTSMRSEPTEHRRLARPMDRQPGEGSAEHEDDQPVRLKARRKYRD